MPEFAAPDPDYAARVRSSFDRQPFMGTLGVSLDLVEPGRVTLSLRHAPGLTQQHGFLHGGVMASVLDSACGYAAFSLMPAGTGVLTVDFTLNLMAPATGERLVATGEVVRSGRTITVCRGVARSDDGNTEREIAAMQATIMTITDRKDVQG